MAEDVFARLKAHYSSVAEDLISQAKQAGLLENTTAVGTEREELYRDFLERHVPKQCDVFLGGYIFDMEGNQSKQIDVIVTGGNTPRFRLPGGKRFIAPLEGTIAVAEIKSRLDQARLYEALDNCSSIPVMPDSSGTMPPYFKKPNTELWDSWPFKIILAFNGAELSTLQKHISDFYKQNPDISVARRPNVIHVLGKYILMRMHRGLTVCEADGTQAIRQPALETSILSA